MGSVAGGSNLKNAVIAFLAPLPSILFYLSFLNHNYATIGTGSDDNAQFLSSLWTWCFNHPLLLVNVLFFFNINVLFWVIGQIQSSHWMIDFYWTVIPLLIVHYYATHPLADYNHWRSLTVILITWVWGIRLNHNYFRREKWQWGAREDWRFTEMGQQYGKLWWWVSFFAVYVSQQVFLIGVTFPFYVVHTVTQPLNVWDLIAVLVCVSGIVIAYLADTQLYDYVCRNNKLKELGKPMVPVLEKGLWFYSRHPNYFGELLWWWGLVIFAWNLGNGWTFVGSLINTMCLAHVTKLVEDRMVKQEYRAEAYRYYQKTTSVWVPWLKSSPVGGKVKNI
ncbi:3-oxo-5-alpha-steroid 4-dehydrogenase (DUF1295) [Quillaja saponaria]|uniref:3-oxo-5-alpha-steroid 4-dehydrogenase (DUF1295) n=1 Tax=Quillaja saponaria TaxID=32244 RepID=A0AAD7LS83_QUISA|nr:3-oxo-5-alpha-steroid 4-dehydrogenase (DUF1295) [Quillaja saponaria]